MKQLIFIVFALAAAPQPAKAQLACALDVSPVQFESVTGTSAGAFDARGAVTVTCTGSQGANIAACVEIGQGATGSSGQRFLSPPKGTGALPMQIFQDTSLTRPWGITALNQAVLLQRSGDGAMAATAYLRVYIQKGGAVSGTYLAHFPITLRYGAVTGNFADCNALGTAATRAASPAVKPIAAGPLRRRR